MLVNAQVSAKATLTSSIISFVRQTFQQALQVKGAIKKNQVHPAYPLFPFLQSVYPFLSLSGITSIGEELFQVASKGHPQLVGGAFETFEALFLRQEDGPLPTPLPTEMLQKLLVSVMQLQPKADEEIPAVSAAYARMATGGICLLHSVDPRSCDRFGPQLASQLLPNFAVDPNSNLPLITAKCFQVNFLSLLTQGLYRRVY